MKQLVDHCNRLRSAMLDRITSYARAENGSLTVETVLVFPLLAWALTAVVTFTDAYRNEMTLQKAAFTAGDLLSRLDGDESVSPADLAGLHRFMERISDSNRPLFMRATLVGWDEATESHVVVWSNADNAGPFPRMTTEALALEHPGRIPPLWGVETMLLTEAWLLYDPPFQVGISPRLLTQNSLTRPRFAPGIVYDDPDAPPPPVLLCDYVVDDCEQ